jgi:hypothetical protein
VAKVPAGRDFRSLLQQAIQDITVNGYDSPEQIELWIIKLRDAAEREVGGLDRSDPIVRRQLEAVYAKAVSKGGIAARIPEIPRYTVQMVAPHLRAELDRRIIAATDYIKIRREEAGWATSIPKGGDRSVNKVDTTKLIGKSLQQFRFEQRRVAIDQGHKLMANVSEIVAADNDAIAAEWCVVHRSGYENRPAHKARAGEIFLVRGCWALTEGLIKRAGRRYIDEVERPAQLPLCSCSYRYITSPKRLPEDMLTAKGRAWVRNGVAA